ncbi:MAG: ABC-2 transporter permease [Oscillospiraceae bacterium]|nr:ABC-2 transporter permease [Oscillospiraceae bacterium]
MKALLLNDFYMVKKDYKTYGFIIGLMMLFFIIVSMGMSAESFFDFSYLITPFIAFAFSITSAVFHYDEKAGFMQYALTMPFTKKQYVKEKYIFHMLNSVISCVLAITTLTIIGMIRGMIFDRNNLLNLGEIALMILIVSSFMGIWEISCVMKFGSSRAKIIVASLTITVGVISALIVSIIPEIQESDLNHMILLIINVMLIIFFGVTLWMYHMGFVWASKKEF